VLDQLQKEMNYTSIHSVSQALGDLTQIAVDLHVLAILIINLTRTPQEKAKGGVGYTALSRVYRVIELIAGLVTPLAKR
jgi:hypothetical protein